MQDASGTTSINMATGTVTINQNNGRGYIWINSDGIFWNNANDNNVIRIFVQQNGTPVIVAEGTPLVEFGNEFKLFNGVLDVNSLKVSGDSYSARTITVDGQAVTVLAQ